MEVKIDEKMYFICHIAEGYTTRGAYNSGDPDPEICPVLLRGEPFHIKTSIMDVIREGFPEHHKEEVPVQMCLAITPNSKAGSTKSYEGSLISLLYGAEIDTGSYAVVKMKPTVTESLSFKRDRFPIEFWTHSSRRQVINSALKDEKRKPSPDPKLVALYEEGVAIEKALDKAEKNMQAFKCNNFEQLPHSYREATFQLAVYKMLPNDRTKLLKQYNAETGMFGPDGRSNNVHIKYYVLTTTNYDFGDSEVNGPEGIEAEEERRILEELKNR